MIRDNTWLSSFRKSAYQILMTDPFQDPYDLMNHFLTRLPLQLGDIPKTCGK